MFASEWQGVNRSSWSVVAIPTWKITTTTRTRRGTTVRGAVLSIRSLISEIACFMLCFIKWHWTMQELSLGQWEEWPSLRSLSRYSPPCMFIVCTMCIHNALLNIFSPIVNKTFPYLIDNEFNTFYIELSLLVNN